MKKRVKSSNVFGEKQKLIIAKILINLRELNFLTQTDIAKHLHLSPSTISHYEKGLTVPPTEVVYRLADFYNVTTDYILGKSASRTNLNDTYAICIRVLIYFTIIKQQGQAYYVSFLIFAFRAKHLHLMPILLTSIM